MSDLDQCPQCGSDLPANFPPGVCPACLLKQGMSPSTIYGPDRGSRPSGSRRKWTPPTPEELAPRFPQLEIVELLGQGGMGAVYKVRQLDLSRWAALKILSDEVAGDPNFAERFQREARAMAQLGHQHIVIVYEFGQRDGLYFLLMEYIDGVTLRQASRTGQVSTKEALSIVTQICDALQFAHEEGVVHRDIKPENILIDKRGRVKIADFGLAKLLGQTVDAMSLTGTHQVMGTPVYMAPEQMEGTKGVDHRADLFSLGVVFYELLTGELPLGRFAPPSQKYALDIRLDEVVLRSLEKEPDRRYQQASQIKSDVETIRSQPVPAKGNAPTRPVGKATPAKRHRWLLPVAIVLISMPLACLILPLLFLGWRIQSRSSDYTGPRFIQGDAAPVVSPTDIYMSKVEKEAREQARQQQLQEATQDKNELFAVLQFTNDGVTLHRDAFEPGTLSTEQRQELEKILTEIHNRYLALEAAHTTHKLVRDNQSTTIQDFAAEVQNLENELWIAIDSKFPTGLQKLLRESLPLYADENSPPHRLPIFAGASAGTGPKMRGPALPDQGQTFKYQQLLGCKRSLPIHITIGRQGKWYSWTIRKMVLTWPVEDVREEPEKGKPDWTPDLTPLETGKGPELPSGLRRFWVDPASAEFQKYLEETADTPEALMQRIREAFRDLHWRSLADCHSAAAIDEFLVLVILAISRDGIARKPEDEQLLRTVKSVNPNFDHQSQKAQSRITEIYQRVKESAQTRESFRELTRPFVHEMLGTDNSELFARILATQYGPDPIKIFEKFRFKSRTPTTAEVIDDKEKAPIWLVRIDGKWKIDSMQPMSEIEKMVLSLSSPPDEAVKTETLEKSLLALDQLRAGANTPWEQVEKQTNNLLAKYTSPADQGRIHWQAAHVYGQSDISGHSADVTRHAQAALKYERDPVQRGWLYMYLGSAAEVRDTKPETFVERRDLATRWYLRGYNELLPFRLPEFAPELPAINKPSSEVGPNDEFDPERVAAEIRQATEIKVREQTAVTRELVQRRDIYMGRLTDLFGRMHEMYDKEADAKERLSEIVRSVFQSAREPEAIRNDLLRRVFPAASDIFEETN